MKFTSKGDFSKANKFFERLLEVGKIGEFDKYGQMGVEALMASTPQDTGATANSWYYTISHHKGGVTVTWHNSNISDGACVAILLQYGHAAKDGTFVSGTDYVNPAMKPVFNNIADLMWKEVTKK